MQENEFDKLVMLFSYKDEKAKRKGYDIIAVNTDGYVCTDGQELTNRVCAFGKAYAALKGYTTYFALDFRYCAKKDVSTVIGEMNTAIRKNAGVCNIYDGFYSSMDLRSFSSSNK